MEPTLGHRNSSVNVDRDLLPLDQALAPLGETLLHALKGARADLDEGWGESKLIASGTVKMWRKPVPGESPSHPSPANLTCTRAASTYPRLSQDRNTDGGPICWICALDRLKQERQLFPLALVGCSS